MPKKQPNPLPSPISFDEVEQNAAQDRLAKMLKESGYQSRFLDKLAGKREG